MAKSPLSFVLTTLAALAAFCLVGCESSERHHRGPEADEPVAPPVAMTGQQVFFDGQIRAEATLGRGRGIHFADQEKSGVSYSGGGGHHGGGRHGGMHGGDGAGGEPPAPASDRSSDGPTIHMHNSPLPAVTLRFRLVNLSPAALTVVIKDVKSDLGDFAVRPEQLTLDPGQTTEVDPMFSQLGVNSDEIPVTVALSIGDKTETHDLVLKMLPPPPPAPPAAPDAPPADAGQK